MEDILLIIPLYQPSFCLSEIDINICKDNYVRKIRRDNLGSDKKRADKDKRVNNLGIYTNIANINKKAKNFRTITNIYNVDK